MNSNRYYPTYVNMKLIYSYLGGFQKRLKITQEEIDTKQAAFQANSTAVDVAGLVADFNSLLSKLKAAGLMAGS